MKRFLCYLLFLLFITICPPSFCQVIDATICDTTSRFPITQYASYLQTTTPITIDSVIKQPSHFAKAENKPVLAFQYDPYYYWFRIVVRNQKDRNRQLMLLMAPVGMYEGKLFQKVNGRWSNVAHAGLKYEFEDRSYQFTHHVYPFTLASNSLDTLYISIDASNAYKYFGFALIQPKELKVFENKIYFVFGIIVGLLLLFFVLNVALFFALKEKLHLWYALYIALLFLIVMKNDHLDQQFLGLDSEQAFRLTPYLSIGALAIAVLMHVVQNFLKPVLYKHKLLYRLSILLKANVFCSAAVHAIVFLTVFDHRIQSFVFNWGQISILAGILITIINCLYCMAKGFKNAIFLFAGSSVFMIGSLQRLFFPSTLSFLFPPTTFHIGIIVETFVITIGLIYRYRSEKELQRKREESEKEEHRQKEEQIQIQTLSDISEEIHDNVGQTLALSKLYLQRAGFSNDSQAREYIDEAKNQISKAISDLRDLTRNLKNELEPEMNITEQIKAECLNVEKTSIFDIDFKQSGEIIPLEKRKQAILIRIIKEVLQNAIKHSEASRVEVGLNFKQGILSIEIKDNGKGYDPAVADQNSNGLKNIKNRCLLLNAKYQIKTEIGKGTEIYIDMDMNKQEGSLNYP